MLIEFRVENYRSIRDEQVFTMAAGRIGRADKSCLREVAGVSRPLLPVAAVYGANASGKSNVLAALAFMVDAVSLSFRAWAPKGGIAHAPFAWGTRRSEPTTLEVEFVIGGVRYRYGFRFDASIFLEEWLYAWPNGKKQTWFTRDREEFAFGEHLKGENQATSAVTRSNALFLSAAAQFQNPQLSPIYHWFGSAKTINFDDLNQRPTLKDWGRFAEGLVADWLDPSIQNLVSKDLEPASSLFDRLRALLQSADLGIVDLRAIRDESSQRGRRQRIEFRHQSDESDAWLPLEEESRGTQVLLRLAVPFLRAIAGGHLLIVDELESSMHPNLAEHLVRQFNDPATNPNNAQLIFSTHDTNLLGTLSGSPALRRDQIWLTEKDPTGASVLYPLTDFKPRQGENIERGYIQGRYGAIPYLGNCRVRAR